MENVFYLVFFPRGGTFVGIKNETRGFNENVLRIIQNMEKSLLEKIMYMCTHVSMNHQRKNLNRHNLRMPRLMKLTRHTRCVLVIVNVS